MELNAFWAKTVPFQSVVTHGTISGMVCRHLFKGYLSAGTRKKLSQILDVSENELEMFLGYLASVHDIGKLEYHFQCKDPNMKECFSEQGIGSQYVGSPNIRHEKTGATAIRRIWRAQGQSVGSCNLFSDLIGAHHQKNYGMGSDSKDPFFKGYQEELEATMRHLFWNGKSLNLPKKPEADRGAAESILLGLIILADWISSGEMFADAEEWIGNADREVQIHHRVDAFLQGSGLRPDAVSWGEEFSNIWPWIQKAGMRPLQQGAEVLGRSSARHSLILMEAPMGEGKTEAGMYCAVQMLRKWEKDGFYAALPTAATSNQMVSRLREWFAANDIPDQIRLLHGMAWMVDDDTCEQMMNTEDHEEVTRWLAPLRRGLLGQFAVGTIDQAMLSVTKARYGVLRLLGLSNKVLVIDEIHSYDVYMGEFILLLLQWCKAMEIPVVMLSATLPPKLKAKLLSPYTSQSLSGAYPMITAVCEDGSVEEIPIEKTVKNMEVSVGLLPILNDPEKIAHKAAELTESGGCICVLMNTVRQAQNVFSALERSFDGKLLLFHAQFPAGKRNEIEQECIRLFGKDKSQRPQKAILVATQVVEQSLDVDFDAMLTAVAPIDLVLQRMGRIFRHDDTIRPKHFQTPAQWILIPDGENFGVDAYVYPEVLLRQTAHLLTERNTVKIPEDLAPLVAAGYDDSKVPPEECEKWMEHVLGEQIEAGQSRKYLIGAPDKIYSALGDSSQLFDDEGENKYLTVQTRLGEPSVRIALLEPELYAQVAQCTSDGVAKVRDRKLAEQVLQQSVSVDKRRISFQTCDLLDTMGAMLLAGAKIYPAQNGCCEFPGGRICFDPKLGLVIEEEK